MTFSIDKIEKPLFKNNKKMDLFIPKPRITDRFLKNKDISHSHY